MAVLLLLNVCMMIWLRLNDIFNLCNKKHLLHGRYIIPTLLLCLWCHSGEEVKKAWVIMELHSGSVSSVIDVCQQDAAPLTVREKVDMAHDSLYGLDHIHSMVRTVNEIRLSQYHLIHT